MAADAWLPRGFDLGEGATLRSVVGEGHDWQIYSTSRKGAEVLVARQALARRWKEAQLLPEGALRDVAFGSKTYALLLSGSDHVLAALEDCRSPQSMTEALGFAASLRSTRRLTPDTPLHDAIYVERFTVLLPTYTVTPALEDDVILGSYLSGGVHVSCHSARRLAAMLTWLPGEQLAKVVETAGLADGFAQEVSHSGEGGGTPGDFTLAGRPTLEQFFREHVIDIVQHRERYRALGIESPSAIILHGPPGCGKTYAVEQLVSFLGWPMYQVASGTLGSPYIHETSRKVAEMFDTALDHAPSVMVIDEMESFLSDRAQGAGTASHRVEEVAEFLRRIPEAVKGGVLIVGMTNRLEMIDPAILRRGRFDHVIEVGMPTEVEVHALLTHLLGEVPTAPDVRPDILAPQLSGRPLSDTAFVVREAGRLAARAGRDDLDQASLVLAVASAPPRDDTSEARPRIGFV